MKQFFLITFAAFFCFVFAPFASAQIPTNVLVQIVRAEDERRFDATLEKFLKDADAKIRVRAALAAGRIGDERAIPALLNLLQDSSVEVQTMAMFALGETESIKAADAVLKVLEDTKKSPRLRARAVEAAGKIAAANAKNEKSKQLGEAILETLHFEDTKRSGPYLDVIELGLTAVLRARPANSEKAVVRYIEAYTPQIRATALNTLARLRAKDIDKKTLEKLREDSDPLVRANAIRLFGIPDYNFYTELVLEKAMFDKDERVRVNAVRALATLDKLSSSKLLVRTQTLWAEYQSSRKRFQNPKEKNEMLEIATVLGRLLANTNNQEAIDFLNKFNEADNYESPEIQIALARIAPARFTEFQRNRKENRKSSWKEISAMLQGATVLAAAPDNAETKTVKNFTKAQILVYVRTQMLADLREDKILSDALTAYAAFKPSDLQSVLRDAMQQRDAIVRTTAAGLLADLPSSKENVEALKSAFTKSLLTDKHENDAQLAILDALAKLDKKSSVGIFLTALNAPDYLVRKKAFDILSDQELQEDSPGIPSSLENFTAKKQNQVLPYASYTGTKLGQILNTNADYARAVSRKNGTVKAVLTTTKGNFTIDFYPEDAPLTVDNFIKLARSNYFNGVLVHRVVANFVMQDGDPRGDGNGGPGWQIRCEINTLPYERGAVGMALSGKDTGGSQWFVTHSPQPHLDGGYTVFGKVNEPDMKIVDSIVRGDKILSVKIVESGLPRKVTKGRKNQI